MNTTKKLLKDLKRLYGQTLNLFVQMEVLNGLLHIGHDEKHYYIVSYYGEFFVGIRNALVTAIIVDFAKIVSDNTKNTVSLKRIELPPKSLDESGSRDEKFNLNAKSSLDAWFNQHSITIKKIKDIRNIEAAHNNDQNINLGDKLFWADAEECIKQLQDLLLKIINSFDQKDLDMEASRYGSDARIQTTKIFELLMESHKQQYERALNAV